MKRRYLAVLMGVMVAATSVPATVFAENTKTESTEAEGTETEGTETESTQDADAQEDDSDANKDQSTAEDSEENTILGEVKSVSDTEITIAVGTKKEMGQSDGDGQNGAPQKPDTEDGNAATITVQSMEMGGQGGPGGDGQGTPGQGGPGGQSQGVDSYTAVNEYTEDTTVSNETLESTGTDENAALISSGASVTLDNDTITRTSDSSTGGDNSSFYGVGAAVLATDGTAYVKDGSVTTDAAIRSDRGGGTMVVDGGTYTSNGVGSPAIYSTADIAVSNATLTANGSEAICVEGLNSIHLYDCDLTGNMSDLDQNDNTWTVILYQSMSGDSEVGNSTFQMDGGSLTSENGGVFYTTNTESTITLSNVDITYNDDNEFFLQCTGNTNQRGWGQSGANGADCNFTGISQQMEGDVIWDSISDLDFYLTDGSSLTGAVVDDETYAGEGGDGYCNVYVSEDSTWTATGDSTVSSLENEGTIVDSDGNTVTIQGTDGTVYVEGTSAYTITTDSYSDSADLSGATSIQDQSIYTVEKPDQL